MSLTYGFYNSINEDRKYNASQMAKLFDGVLNDGIFMSIGDKLMVSANTGMNVSVGTGRAWFDHTWTLNDSILVLPVAASELLLNRIDTVVLEVNNTEAVRANSIKIIKGAGATVPVAPTLVNTSEIHQYPLAHIYVGVGVTEIIAANITNKVGTSETPFATGVMQGMNIDALVTQWESEFDIWFDDVNAKLGTAPATNLQNQINTINSGTTLGPAIFARTEKTTPVNADMFALMDSAASNATKKLSWANIKATLKTYFDTLYNNYVHPTTAGNKHIPAGGAANQVLKYSADGTAVWGTDNDTIYVHPANHSPSVITQDASNRFVTDAEKTTWNGKVDASHTHSYLPLSGGTIGGKVLFESHSTIGASAGIFTLESIAVNSQAAGMTFHRPNSYGINFGLDTDNSVKLGGWSHGLNAFRFISDTGGNFTASGNVTAYSDERLKDNIVTIPNALDKVLALRGVEFDRNGVHNIGLIAQEVQKVIPEIVLENSDEMKTLSVAYANLVGLLIEAIKEQQAQIDELKAKVN